MLPSAELGKNEVLTTDKQELGIAALLAKAYRKGGAFRRQHEMLQLQEA